MTLELDTPISNEAISGQEQPDSIAAKLSRELHVVGGGLCDGIKERAAQVKDAKEKILPQIGLSAGVGAVLSLAQGEAGVVKLGAEIVGAAFTAGFAKDLLNKERLASIGSALKDTWNSADHLDSNREKIATGAGQFAFDSALMIGSGALGAAAARGSRLAFKLDLPSLKGATFAEQSRLEYTLGRSDSVDLGSARQLPLAEVFPDNPFTVPRRGRLLTDEMLNLPVPEISRRERIVWTKGAPSGADIQWEPSEASIAARQDAQKFVGQFMQRDYLGALKTAVESKVMERVSLNPASRKSQVLMTLDDFQQPEEMCQRLDQLCDLGKFDWKQRISNEVGEQQLGVVLPRPVIELPSGKAVAFLDYEAADDSTNPGYKVVLPETTLHGEPLSTEELEKMRALRQGEPGQRVIAETALIAFEESIVHLNQHAKANGEIISPTFAEFSKDYSSRNQSRAHMQAFAGAISRTHPLRTALYEQEVPALLYDAGMPLPVVERHYFFGSHHVAERTPVMDFLKSLDGTTDKPAKT